MRREVCLCEEGEVCCCVGKGRELCLYGKVKRGVSVCGEGDVSVCRERGGRCFNECELGVRNIQKW